MIKIKPFKGIRPSKAFAHTVPSRSFESYTEEEIKAVTARDKTSFLNVISHTKNREILPEKRLERVQKHLMSFLNKGYLKRDNTACFYAYRQEKGEHTTTGIIALTTADDYLNEKIRIHENTLAAREKRFTNYLETVAFHAEPVLLTFPDDNCVHQIIYIETRKTPTYKYYSEEEGISHTFWVVDNRLNIRQIIDGFKQIDHLYVADGHHRIASAAAYTQHKRACDKSYVGIENYNYILSYLIPESEVNICAYNRLVKDLNGHSPKAFLSQLEGFCTVHPKGDTPYYPSQKHHISLYTEGKFYGLFIKHELRGQPRGLGELDTYLFEENVLTLLLDIRDTRQDKRIAFSPGSGDIRGIMEMKARIDSGEFKAGFAFYPVCIEDLKRVADLKLTMPPKSTYIEPKLHSGMIIYNLDD